MLISDFLAARNFTNGFFYIVLLLPSLAFAQTDTVFWFAAPDVSVATLNFDKPILLRISAGNQPAVVTISQPANPSFLTQTANVPANGTVTVDLTSQISIVENRPPNTVLNYGLLIKSTSFITVYYEVLSLQCLCNPEIFSLKGSNALGTDFFIPSQNFWRNTNTYTPTPYESFDIVATEDNTNVTITPSKNIVGHSGGVTFSMALNKGQTYSATATSQLASEHLGGSRVISDKPIAITVKDDLLENLSYGTCRDLAGDQIVPTNVIGKKYVAVKGFLGNADKAFIMATQNGTNVFINGNAVPVATLSAGQIHAYDVVSGASYIEASQPVYVLHVSGFGCEVGSSLLPSIECTGSQQVSFTRSTNENFGLIVIVKSGGQNSFVLNGNGSLLPGSSFTVVPGSAGQWYYARVTFNTTQIPVGTASMISNPAELFHVGIINGDNIGGCSYGYFSNFNALIASTLADTSICSGESLILNARGGINYSWIPGSFLSDSLIANPIATPDSTLTYTVIVSAGACMDTTDVTITVNPSPIPFISQNDTICDNDSSQLLAGGGDSYSWLPLSLSNPNISDPVATPDSTTTYIVEISSSNGCAVSDSVTVFVLEHFVSNIDEHICPGDSFLAAGNWQYQAGVYRDTLTAQAGCDSIIVTNLFVDTIITNRNVAICVGDSLFLENVWQKNDGVYRDTFSSFAGCDSVVVTNLTVNTAILTQTSMTICEGDSIFSGGSWQSQPGIYTDTFMAASGCDSIANTVVTVADTSISYVFAKICSDDSLFVGGGWQSAPGTYIDVFTNAANCDSTIVTVLSVASVFNSSISVTICEGDSFFAGGAWRFVSGSYSDSFMSVDVCDSVIVTVLSVNPNYQDTAFLSICRQDSVFVGGGWQTQTGVYIDSQQTIAGCDSITVTNLSVLDTIVVSQTSSVCDGDSIFLANAWQTNPGVYYDSATGSAGCDSITVTTLSINSSPFVTTISDTTIEFGASVVLNTISNASSLVWSPDSSLSCVQCTNPVASPGQTITYMVQATDSNNCIAEDMVTINVLDSECKVAMPTAFSPNGDGVNEKIGPFINGDVQIEEFRIYNRWGQLVFEAINSNAWWDGVYKDEVQHLSVYVYYLKYTCNGVSKVQSGNITLVQ